VAERDVNVHEAPLQALHPLIHATDRLCAAVDNQLALGHTFVTPLALWKADRRGLSVGQMHFPFDLRLVGGHFTNPGGAPGIVDRILEASETCRLAPDSLLLVFVLSIRHRWMAWSSQRRGNPRRLGPDKEVVGTVADPRDTDGRVDAICDWHKTP